MCDGLSNVCAQSFLFYSNLPNDDADFTLGLIMLIIKSLKIYGEGTLPVVVVINRMRVERTICGMDGRGTNQSWLAYGVSERTKKCRPSNGDFL